MPVALQYRGAGGSAARLAYTPLSGEAWFDTDVNGWFIGDGSTGGGREVANALVTAISTATYNVQSTDVGRFFVFTNATGCAIALNQSTTTYFPVQSGAWFFNHSPATCVITATTSLINGASTLTLNAGDSCVIVADGTNYFALTHRSGLSGGTPVDIFIAGNTTAGTSSSTVSLIGSTLSAVGGISLGFSGSTLIYSNPLVGATESVTALGNTTASTSSTTLAIGSSLLSGAGDLSIGFSSSTLVFSAPAAATSGSGRNVVLLGNTTGATSSTVLTLTNMSFSGAAGASVGFSTTLAGQGVVIVSQGAIGASATGRNMFAVGANTAGTTTSQVATLTAKSYSAGGFLSLGFSAGTIIVSGSAHGVASLSYWEPRPFVTGTTNFSLLVGGNSHYLIPVNNLPATLTFNRIKLLNSYNYASIFGPLLAVVTTTTSDTLTASCSFGATMTAAAFTSNNMTQMTSVTSASISTAISASASVSRSSNSISVTQSISFLYNVDTNTSQTTITTSTSSTSSNNFGLGTNTISNFFTGAYDWVVPLATTFGMGLNAVGVKYTTSTGAGSLSTAASYANIAVPPVNALFYHNGALGNVIIRTSFGAAIGAGATYVQRPYGAGITSTNTLIVASYNPESVFSTAQGYGALYIELYTAP